MAYANMDKREDHTYSYDPNVDYSKKMDEAVAAGDYASAAQYEKQRNEKIAGEGLTQYQQTNKYTQYLPYDQQMDDIFSKIMNRKDFSYDVDADALYQQYKDKYMQQGKLAMQDTMGQAAALTGGYGNSYAQAVGQQAYNQYLGGLNDVVPELYSLARERYDAEGNKLMNQYSLLADRENTEYSRNFAEEEREYNRNLAEEERNYNRNAAEEEKAYNLALSMLQSGIMPSQALLDASGISAEDAKKIYDAANTPSYSYSGNSGGSSGGSNEDNKGKTITGKDSLSSKAKNLYEKLYDLQRPWEDSQVYYDLAHPKVIVEEILRGSITFNEGIYIGRVLGYGFDNPAQMVMDLMDAGYITESEATAMYEKYL